ncbi:MAG: hypothetical protein KKF44_05800, partial [Nanoarchaeota archaeon]|nr:hypothetical protein [Nanoarchaeota archaeon]
TLFSFIVFLLACSASTPGESASDDCSGYVLAIIPDTDESPFYYKEKNVRIEDLFEVNFDDKEVMPNLCLKVTKIQEIDKIPEEIKKIDLLHGLIIVSIGEPESLIYPYDLTNSLNKFTVEEILGLENIEELRSHFSDDAVTLLYACRPGAESNILEKNVAEAIAYTFDTKVMAPKHEYLSQTSFPEELRAYEFKQDKDNNYALSFFFENFVLYRDTPYYGKIITFIGPPTLAQGNPELYGHHMEEKSPEEMFYVIEKGEVSDTFLQKYVYNEESEKNVVLV